MTKECIEYKKWIVEARKYHKLQLMMNSCRISLYLLSRNHLNHHLWVKQLKGLQETWFKEQR